MLSFSDLCPQNYENTRKGHSIQTKGAGGRRELVKKVCPGEMMLELSGESLELTQGGRALQGNGQPIRTPGGRKESLAPSVNVHVWVNPAQSGESWVRSG